MPKTRTLFEKTESGIPIAYHATLTKGVHKASRSGLDVRWHPFQNHISPSYRRAEAGLPGFWHGAMAYVMLDKRIAEERYAFTFPFLSSSSRR